MRLQPALGELADGPRLLLPDHHREVDAACLALLDYMDADEPVELVEQYRCFEREIVRHLVTEEQAILPAYAEHAPTDAQAIRDDHAAIRKLLFHIGVEVELHTVRAETVKELVELLRAHAAREDAAMYPWAQVQLSLRTKQQLFGRVGRSMRTLERLRLRLRSLRQRPLST